MGTELGRLVRERRKAMFMSLNALTQAMGGSPGPSFLHRIETGEIYPSREVSTRLAKALILPSDIVLNAAGHTSEAQMEVAAEKLSQVIGETTPTLTQIPVYDSEAIEEPTGERRPRVLKKAEEMRIVDLHDPANEPFVGEVMYAPLRAPQDKQGVVVSVSGRAAAGTWRQEARKSWIENSEGKVLDRGFKVQGVIVRVTRSLELDESV